MTNAIELNHISKSFGEFSLKNVTLAIPAGTICGLVGENGAGKSTLIRILMGALRPDSGTAAFSVRLIDCVGYMVRGALGQTEDDQPRMVTTPWYDHPIPMTEAAEIGTRKVYAPFSPAKVMLFSSSLTFLKSSSSLVWMSCFSAILKTSLISISLSFSN